MYNREYFRSAKVDQTLGGQSSLHTVSDTQSILHTIGIKQIKIAKYAQKKVINSALFDCLNPFVNSIKYQK